MMIVLGMTFQTNVPANEVQSERVGPEGEIHTPLGHSRRRRLPLQISQQVKPSKVLSAELERFYWVSIAKFHSKKKN